MNIALSAGAAMATARAPNQVSRAQSSSVNLSWPVTPRPETGELLAEFFNDGNALGPVIVPRVRQAGRSEEHTSELQSLMRISYAVFCLKKKNKKSNT